MPTTGRDLFSDSSSASLIVGSKKNKERMKLHPEADSEEFIPKKETYEEYVKRCQVHNVDPLVKVRWRLFVVEGLIMLSHIVRHASNKRGSGKY